MYVDVILVTSNDEEGQQLLGIHLAKEFEIKTLGKLEYFLGVEVVHYKKVVFCKRLVRHASLQIYRLI